MKPNKAVLTLRYTRHQERAHECPETPLWTREVPNGFALIFLRNLLFLP
jgi:hypothetical protein